jgi:ectoine hydroxylase-related dioxygenase (phytanoyl-CoA dioxygenase family)
MTQLTTLPATASKDDILAVIHQDGAVIVRDLITPAEVDRVLDETRPYIDATRSGADEFSGFKTTRTGALVARSPACRELILNGSVMEAAREFLAPYCARIQLHLGQIIRLMPGQPSQAIHRDRWAWGTYLKDLEPQFNTIWAISDFTRENGATRVVPGSVSWPDDRRPTAEEVVQAEMSRGSALLYTGSVFHGGGENCSKGERIGMNLTYTLGWLRQEENQYLSCPPDIARDLSAEMQDLLGYTLGSYALGYYTPPLPPGEGPESVGPEWAVGRETEGEGLGSEELFEAVSGMVGGVDR